MSSLRLCDFPLEKISLQEFNIWRNVKYFITGGAGFVGSHMVDRLLTNKNNEVVVFDNFCSGQRSYLSHHVNDLRLQIIAADMLDLDAVKEAVRGCDFVFHFAANPDIAKSMIQTDLDLQQTVISTYNLVEAMRLNGVPKIAYSSGSGIYGDVGLTETAENFGPLLPVSMYGASKLGAEGIISAFCHMFDMQAWIYRFANVVGGRQTHGVGFDFIRKLREDNIRLEILGDGNQSKSYIHVSDVVDAMLYVIEKVDDPVNVFNVATGDYITVNDIARFVVEEMGISNIRFEYTGGSRGWKGDVPVVRFDLRKIHTLGWQAQHNSEQAFRRSIREMLEYM
jgi:UDP-glucose 4-epimerase